METTKKNFKSELNNLLKKGTNDQDIKILLYAFEPSQEFSSSDASKYMWSNDDPSWNDNYGWSDNRGWWDSKDYHNFAMEKETNSIIKFNDVVLFGASDEEKVFIMSKINRKVFVTDKRSAEKLSSMLDLDIKEVNRDYPDIINSLVSDKL
jgi:hypothetical protein